MVITLIMLLGLKSNFLPTLLQRSQIKQVLYITISFDRSYHKVTISRVAFVRGSFILLIFWSYCTAKCANC